MYTGPHLIKDNLVFGYDTGYGVADNNTSTRFYPGEPTVNSLASTAFGYSGITLGSDSGGTYLETNSSTSGYNYIKVPNITVSSNETYTWSFELKSTETITQSGNKYYFDTNEYSNEFSNSNDQSRVSSSQVRPSSLPANEWVKFALTVTMKPNLTGAYSYDFLNFIKPHFTSKKIYYRNMQFEHNKSHHTPFVNGTRSSTQSLIDLKRTTDIDVSNVYFDSTGQPSFDGSDDKIELSSYLTNLDTSLLSLEFVFRTNIGTGTFQPLLGWHYGRAGHGYVCLGNFTGYWGNESISFYNEGTGATPLSFAYTNGHSFLGDTNYHHAVIVLQTGNYRIYVDGEEVTVNASFRNGSQSTVMQSNLFGYGTGPKVGIGVGSQTEAYLNGRIPITKIYNRALSASEVKQNYNAYKNRFDI